MTMTATRTVDFEHKAMLFYGFKLCLGFANSWGTLHHQGVYLPRLSPDSHSPACSGMSVLLLHVRKSGKKVGVQVFQKARYRDGDLMESKKQEALLREFGRREENIFEVLFCALTLEVNDNPASVPWQKLLLFAKLPIVPSPICLEQLFRLQGHLVQLLLAHSWHWVSELNFFQ